MKAKILMAGLAFFAFTTIGVAQGTAKKADTPAKTECGSGKACCAAKTECGTTKTVKAPATKTATTSKKAVAKPTAKK